MADIERKYADLIFRASRKYPSWDPEIPVRCGDYGRITLGRPAWMFWRRRMGVFVKEGNIYDDGKAKEWDIPEPSGEYGAHESEGLTWVTSQNGEEIDIHSAVSCQTPALMSCKVRAAFKFSSGSGAILVMVNDTITSIEPASRLRRLLDDKSMKGLVIVSQVHRCDSYARLLTTEASKFVAVGLTVDTSGGAAGGEGEAKWVRSTNSGNFKTRVNKNGSRDFYPLFKLVSIVNNDLSSGLRSDEDAGDDVLPDAEPPWTEVTVQDNTVEQELSPESQGALPSGRHFNAQRSSPSDIFLPALNYSGTSLGTTGLIAGGPTPLPPTSNIPSNLLGKHTGTEAAKMPIGIQIERSAINNLEVYNNDLDMGMGNDTKDENESDDETIEDNTNLDQALLQWEPDPWCQLLSQVDASGPLLNGIGSSGIDLFPGACNILKTVFATSSKYKKLLRLEQSTAQLVLDVIQIILDYAVINLMDSKFQNMLLKTMLHLSKRSALCPRSYILSDIQRDEYPIASGHFGEIYRGNYSGRKVSLKVFKLYASQMSKIKDLLKAFYKEAILWRHLVHINLLPFYGVYQLGDSGGRICLVSPWMDNGNITQYLQRSPDTNRQHLVLDIAQGIAYLHGRSIVHGDLKGANVLISDNGVACLADFGLSSIINTHMLTWTSIETTVSNAGTVRWQAPELIGIEDTPDVGVTKESDMYAFACVCYEIFIGNVPFYQLTYQAAVIRKVMLGQRPLRPEPNSLPYTTWGLSDCIWSLIEECWCEGPTDRLKSSEVVERLSSKEEFRRDEVKNLDNWGDLRPEVFRSLLDQQSPVSNDDILLSVSLLNSL